MKVFIIVIILTVLSNKYAKSQELLGMNKNQLIKLITLKGGLLKVDRLEQDVSNPHVYDFLFFKYPESMIKKNDKYATEIYIINENCVKYLEEYKTNKSFNDQVKNLNDFNSGFKRDGNALVWRDIKGNFEIEILKKRYFDKKKNALITDGYILDYHFVR